MDETDQSRMMERPMRLAQTLALSMIDIDAARAALAASNRRLSRPASTLRLYSLQL